MRKLGGYLLAFVLGAATGSIGVCRATRAERDALRDHFVAGLIDNVRIVEEIREGQAPAVAERLTKGMPDYVWEVEEGFLDSPWRAPAFRVAKEFLRDNKVPLKPPIDHILRHMLGELRPAAILRDNVVHVFPPGASFEVPPGWQAWALRFGGNVHTPQGDLRRVVWGAGEWDAEYSTIVNAIFPPAALVFHGGDEGWGGAGGSFGDLQLRVYAGQIALSGAQERLRAAFPKARLEAGTFEGWEVARIEFDVWYGDYGGTGRVDCYVRDAGADRVALVFMHTGRDQEIESILRTYRFWKMPPNLQQRGSAAASE